LNEVAVQGKLADQRIDLTQAQWHLGPPLQIAAHEAILVDTDFQSRGAGIIDGCSARTS